MTIFQYAGLSVIVILILTSLRNLMAGRGRPSIVLGWTAVWAVAGIAIYEPEATTVLARAIGIQRGADLVLYCSVLAGLVGFFIVYLQMRRTDREITLLVRELALQQAWQVDSHEAEITHPTNGNGEDQA